MYVCQKRVQTEWPVSFSNFDPGWPQATAGPGPAGPVGVGSPSFLSPEQPGLSPAYGRADLGIQSRLGSRSTPVYPGLARFLMQGLTSVDYPVPVISEITHLPNGLTYRVFSHDVTAAMLVSQIKPLGICILFLRK